MNTKRFEFVGSVISFVVNLAIGFLTLRFFLRLFDANVTAPPLFSEFMNQQNLC
jgi:hypothetical protein